ncbi:MAG: tetratricopeptide repeat protein, partial [Mucilaginibacter sp.]
MTKYLIFIFFTLVCYAAKADEARSIGKDSSSVNELNRQGFNMRMTSPEQTLADANKALKMARDIKYTRGIAESYRVMGIGYYYLDDPVKAIHSYLTAKDYFIQLKDMAGEASVYNNIGNLYRYTDYDLSLEFFNKTLDIAKKLNNKPLIAGSYNNMGTVYYHKASFYQALNYYNKSTALFTELKDSVNLVQLMENIGE